MADFLAAWLRELGSIAGLLSLGYVVFDRFFKDCPRASITMGDHGPLVLIANPSSADVTMIGYRVMPAAYGVARDEDKTALSRLRQASNFQQPLKPPVTRHSYYLHEARMVRSKRKFIGVA